MKNASIKFLLPNAFPIGVAVASRCVCFGLGWLSDVCVSAVCVSAVLCLVCLPLRVRPRVCPVPVLRF